ncbi:MAG: histidine kinase [Parafilimonas sp.]|nr:histidine kinase [Parafilimonas sp.]
MLEKICEAKNYQTIIASWGVASGYYDYCKHALQQGNSTLANNCYDKAIEYDLKTLQIAKDLKDSNWIPGLYMSIGSFYDKCNICEETHLKEESNLIKANYFHKTEEYYFKAFKIFRKSNDSNGICTCYFNLGLFYRNQGVLLTQANKFSEAKIDYQKSLDYYFKAFAIIKKLGYKHGIANYSKELGTTYLKLNKCNKAEFYLLNAASTFEELGYKEGAKETYELLSEVSLKKKDYKKALDYYKNFSGLKDSLMNEETAKQLTEAEIKYETEKKDNEIVLLNKNKQIEEGKIKQQSRNIFFIVLVAALFILSILVYIKFEQNKTALHLKQLQQKALRAQLNPHFIFNAMQSIQRAYESNNKKGEELLINFSLLMRDVLNKSFLSEVTLEEELELTMKYLKVESQRFARACNFNASIDEVINTSEVAFPSMVLQPVFENAVKYGAGNINFKH